MRKSVTIFYFIALIAFTTLWNLSMADSTLTKNKKLQGGFNFTLLNTSNWQGSDIISYSFSTDIEYNLTKALLLSQHFSKIKLELGFTRILDSTWQKQSDQFVASYIFKAGRKRLSKTGFSMFTTRMLNSYEYYFNSQKGHTDRTKTGVAFNPSSWEIGYGTGYTFFQQSIINFSLATARLRLMTEMANTNVQSIQVGKLGNGTVYFDYGFSLQYNVSRELNKRFVFNSTGKMFLKGFNRDKLEMDVSSTWMIKLTKYLVLRSDVKVVYAPTVSYRLQLRNEFLIGFIYDSVK